MDGRRLRADVARELERLRDIERKKKLEAPLAPDPIPETEDEEEEERDDDGDKD